MLHPDEGTIHAWLDGALPLEEAQAFEAHIATCPACAAAVANARGVLAAASRILSALDNVPAGVIPTVGGTGVPTAHGGARDAKSGGRFRATRWRAAAAIVMVAGASWLVLHPGARKDDAVRQQQTETMALDTARSADQPQSANAERVATNAPSSEPVTRKTAPPLNTAQTRPTVGDVSGVLRGATDLPQSSAGGIGAASPRPMQPGSRTELSKVAISPGVASDSIREEKAARSDLAVRRQSTEMREASRQNVDSILAADSAGPSSLYSRLDGQLGALSTRTADAVAQAAPSMRSGTAKRAAAAPAPPRLSAPVSVSDRAAGCYMLSITPRRPGESSSGGVSGLLPAQLELRRTLGVSGDEQGNSLARPAPGEPALRPGVVGFWKSVGDDKIRVTFADDTSWVVLTLVVTPESVSGPARRWSASTASLESADVRGRRTICRPQ
jgi:hypothetical protein